MPFSLTHHYVAGVLAIRGRFLGSLERPRLRLAFAELAAAGHTRLVIDLSRAEFMDSTGLGLLIEGARMLRALGGDVCLAGLPARIKNLFVRTGLVDGVFETYDTVEEALESFAAAPAA